MRSFKHFAVIDWSGAAEARPKGLAVAHLSAEGTRPMLYRPEGGWSREALLHELLRHADKNADLLIGLDLSPGLPFIDAGAYFPGWPGSPPDAKELWRFVDEASADDPHLAASGFVRHTVAGEHFLHHGRAGSRYSGGAGRTRRCEEVLKTMGLTPYSCFRLVGAAQVGKSSLTGMRVLHRLRGRVPVWPFDPVPATGPMIVEIYPSVAVREAGTLPGNRSKIATSEELTATLAAFDCRPPTAFVSTEDDHSVDAMLTAAWLRTAAARPDHWTPRGLTPAVARTEGWTFGVP